MAAPYRDLALAQDSAARADEALLRPVRQGNAFEETVERVLQVIKLGVVPVGGRLPPERQLSRRLAVSRSTVREAVRALRDAGYVESRRGRHGGTFVHAVPQQLTRRQPRSTSRPRIDSLADVLVFRHVLETGAAEQAAGRGPTRAEADHLRAMLAQTAAAEPADYRRCDSRLHLAVAELCGSASLTAAVADARTDLNDLLDSIPLLAQNIRHSERQHRRVVAAIVQGRPAEARARMHEHLRGPPPCCARSWSDPALTVRSIP